MRDNDAIWKTLPFRFFAPADGYSGPDEEARDAPCGSTLQRPCVLTDEQREQARRDNRARSQKLAAQIREEFAARGLQLPSWAMVHA